MHTVCTNTIYPGVDLTCIKTEKFKTGCLTLNIICGLSRETASSNSLLPHVLRRGSSELPDMERIAAALDELYGARIEPMIRKKGELHSIGFYSDFPDDRYIPGGKSVLEETTALVGGMLLSPDIQDGLMRADYINSEKSNLIDDIRAGINDKRGYSIDRLLEEMCDGEQFGVNKLGSEATALEITPESLTAHYRSIIENSRIEAFYCGSAEPGRVESALRSALSVLPGRGTPTSPKTEIILRPATETPRRFTESLDVTQGKLTAGFRLGKPMENPDYPSMMVFNAIYGSGVTSKLFLNVREKLSLCYYASSILERHKGVMIVASGVEFSKFDAALDEILAQLANVKKGDVSDWELTSAKRAVVTAIKSSMDRPSGLEDLYFDSRVAAFPYDPGKLCENVEAVTLDSVVEIASGIETDSIYLLTGKEAGVGDNGQ